VIPQTFADWVAWLIFGTATAITIWLDHATTTLR
jgi:hypothetical protein